MSTRIPPIQKTCRPLHQNPLEGLLVGLTVTDMFAEQSTTRPAEVARESINHTSTSRSNLCIKEGAA